MDNLTKVKQMQTDSPLKSIPELSTIPEIRSFQDILKVRDFVFKTVPWVKTPLRYFRHKEMLSYYEKFKAKECGGWCGINADFFQSLMFWYQGDVLASSRPYNFGLSNYNISHVGVIVTYDGMDFFIDPYIGLHYIHRDGFLLTFQSMMKLISYHKLDRIVPVFSEALKPMETDNGWVTISSQDMIKSILASWPDYDKVMKQIFGLSDPLLLMQLRLVNPE